MSITFQELHIILKGILMKSLLLLLVLSFPIYAKTPPKLRDIGIIGLMSHDLFSWDRVNEINTENGRLD